MTTTQRSPRSIQQLVEGQIREWNLKRRTRSEPEKAPSSVHEFVTISRTLGSGGNDIAHLLSKKIGWPVFDKEIIQVMAADDDTRRRLYESMDERDRGWVEGFVHTILDRDYQWNDYFKKLVETIASIARQGPAVFLGRGADLILPKDAGLRIRVVAPESDRLRVYARRRGLPIEKVQVELARIDKEREEFIRTHFRLDPGRPTQYDLIFNTERITCEEVADLIGHHLKARRIVK